MSDPYHLQRFVEAQAAIYPQVQAELRAGQSEMARRYALSSLAEAKAYLAHPVLGPRLRDCTGWVNSVENRSINDIFGHPDDMKFHSSMTLFARAADDQAVYEAALDKYFGGQPDALTLARLAPGL